MYAVFSSAHKVHTLRLCVNGDTVHKAAPEGYRNKARLRFTSASVLCVG